uniref:Uncharacterized protein n=1 Tax=Oryza brachyantha TaxID=4533 RepID=J3LCM4_ORYBR
MSAFKKLFTQRRWVHTETTSELLLAVAPYLPQITDQIVDCLPQIAETVGRDVHSVAETTTGLPQLQGEAGPSSSSTLFNPTVEALPFLEMDVNKITTNFKNSYVGKLNEKEIVLLASQTFQLKRKILNELALLAGEENGPLLFNTTGADDILTTLSRAEYKRSYLELISKSLVRKGTESCYYKTLLQKRLEEFPNT